jgi:hypothetical protein
MSSNTTPTDALDPLLQCEDNWVTRMGLSFAGSHVVFRGQDLHADLANFDWIALYLFGITGKQYTAEQLKIFNAMFVYTSYPDPRVWNNRVAALGGTAKSTVGLSMAAAIAVSEAKLYGGLPLIKAIELLLKINKLKKDKPLTDIIATMHEEKIPFYGYGRPIVRRDERIEPFSKLVAQYGYDQGDHYRLAFEVEKELQRFRPRVQMNIAAVYAAIAADFDMSPVEFQAFTSLVFVAGMLPCYLESRTRAPGTFLPVRCDRINYRGPPSREW